MPANFTFAKVLSISLFCSLFLPFSMKGQCAPEIDVISVKLILIYPDGSVPNNLSTIDVDFEGLAANGITVTPVGSNTWQTTGSNNFDGIILTGTVTIHYNDDTPMIVCEYVNGIYNNPLPVELSAFKGHLMQNNIFLSWSTESESENAGFEIERSFDGESFERVAFQNGAGNSNEKLWYSFEDIDVKNVALGTTAYYRIKQINYDQTFWYSWIVAVDLKIEIQGFEITKILGWNNPDRIIKVYFNNPANIKKVNIFISTINGQLIKQKSIYPVEGINFFEIDLSDQKGNLFFMSLNNGKQTTVEKLILHSSD